MAASPDHRLLLRCFEQRRWADLLEALGHHDLHALQDPELWFLFARSYRGMGMPELGYEAMQKAIRLDPDAPGLRIEASAALIEQGQWSAAWDLLTGSAMASCAHWPEVQLLRARCMTHLGAVKEAEQQLLALQGQAHTDLVALGIALAEVNLTLGDFEKARFCFARASQLAPADLELSLLEIDLLAADWSLSHLPRLRQLEQEFPDEPRLLVKVARLLRRHLQLGDARQVLEAAVARHGCLGALGYAWLQCLLAQADLPELQKCLASQPEVWPPVEPLMLEAECLLALDRDQEASQLLGLLAPDGQVLALRAQLLRRDNDHDGCLAMMRQIQQSNPDSSDFAYQLAFQLLSMRRWKEGWLMYERRFGCSFASSFLPPGFYPKNSDRYPEGLKVLVFMEQGFGDAIMLASMLPDLIEVAAHVTVMVPPRLEPLFRHAFPDSEVLTRVDETCFDGMEACYGIGSLGQFFRLSDSDFSGNAYLQLSNSLVFPHSSRLSELPCGVNIGLAWRGGGHIQQHRRRSLELMDLLPILTISGANWINLQYRHSQDELDSFQDRYGIQIHHFEGITEDLLETAALTQSLDLVITVQQTALHVAGAVGTTAWVMVPVAPEWRYGIEGSAMPWYGSVELFRQSALGDWSTPIHQIRQRLEAFVAERIRQNESIS